MPTAAIREGVAGSHFCVGLSGIYAHAMHTFSLLQVRRVTWLPRVVVWVEEEEVEEGSRRVDQ